MNTIPTFNRTTFSTSRLMEFFTEKELQMRMGYSKKLWPLVLLKELIDNSLDACENAGIHPDIEVTLEQDGFSVLDNGPGLPSDTLERSLDYLVRVSDKSHYVSPTRGQLGNALKCLWAAPFVADGDYGRVEVSTGGIEHCIEVTLDHIRQSPQVKHEKKPGFVKTGSFFKIHWPQIANESQTKWGSFYNVIARFALMNPHATIVLKLPDGESTRFVATAYNWNKWKTNQPTSPHWYTIDQLRALIAAYITESQSRERKKTIREFVSEFAGLTGTAKQKLVIDQSGMHSTYLDDLVKNGSVDERGVQRLLDAMKSESRPVPPKALGALGETHITQWLAKHGHSIQYKKAEGITEDRLPYVLEVAFAVHNDDNDGMFLSTGLNWSPTLKNPIEELYRLLDSCRVDAHDPVIVSVHLACPMISFTETGKGAAVLPNSIKIDLEKCLKSVTKQWKQAKRSSDRDNRVRQQALHKLRHGQIVKISIKDAAYHSMEQAYMLASANNTLPANARQIMYAARPLVLELTGGQCWQNSSYFTQHLLPDFMESNPALTADWDVIFDARGRLVEPHTNHRVDLGTLEVRRYLHDWHHDISAASKVQVDYMCPTMGALHRYAYTLFVEKEGFYPLLQRADIANRYDIAIMSTKGMSVTASRLLVEQMSNQGVTILVLHDFDKSGFSILSTLQSDTRRYKFDKPPQIIDLGLRLTDVQELELESEPVEYSSTVDPRDNLRESGATTEECDFLVRAKNTNGWVGARVELNAMASDVFIRWLESKLEELGVGKVVPDEKTLAIAYRRAYKLAGVQRAIDEAIANLDGIDIETPEKLENLVKDAIKGTNTPWDKAIAKLVQDSKH